MGRFEPTHRDHRVCQVCHAHVVEDEQHSLFECPVYSHICDRHLSLFDTFSVTSFFSICQHGLTARYLRNVIFIGGTFCAIQWLKSQLASKNGHSKFGCLMQDMSDSYSSLTLSVWPLLGPYDIILLNQRCIDMHCMWIEVLKHHCGLHYTHGFLQPI